MRGSSSGQMCRQLSKNKNQKIIGKCVDFLLCVDIMRGSWYTAINMRKAETEKSNLSEPYREKNNWWKFLWQKADENHS